MFIPRTQVLIVSATLIAVLSGCQSLQVERKTAALASNLSALQYSQVMDNLALIADSPGSLPHYALAQAGKASVQWSGQATGSLSWDLLTAAGKLFDRFFLDKESIGVQASRVDVGDWDTTPDLDPMQMILMQALYLHVLGQPMLDDQRCALETFFSYKPRLTAKEIQDIELEMNGIWTDAKDPAKAAVLAGFTDYKPDYSIALNDVYTSLETGWVHVGHCKDVPKDACYVGRHCHTYVWVDKENMKSLTNLTIAVLEIAGTDTSSQALRTQKGKSLKTLPPPPSLVMPSGEKKMTGYP